MKVLIYSNKHNAWWRKNYAGYGQIEDAGIYELNDVLSQPCYKSFDFDKSKSNYLVKLEDVMDEYVKRKSKLLRQIDEQMNSLIEEYKSCLRKQNRLEERIANIVYALSQIGKEETE